MNGRLGVISDTHGSLDAWKGALEIWGAVDAILHAGDILYHGPRNPLPEGYDPLILPQYINASSVPVLIARGNCDAEVDQMLLKWPIQSPYVNIWWQGRHILMAHGTNFSSIRELAGRFEPALVITGHTHVGSLVREGRTIYLNPGSASLAKGRDPESVAIIDEDEIRIVTLGGVLLHSEKW